MKRHLGFSIVELLIAVLIGLVAMVAATTAMNRFETSRHSSLGSSESMQNGFLALFAMESDANKAGWGLNDGWVIGCPTLMFDGFLPGGSPGYPLAGPNAAGQPLVPAFITGSTGTTPDTVSFYTGSSNTGTGVVSISGGSYAGDANPIPVSAPVPTFLPGDLYVVAPPPSQVGRICLIGQVSSLITGAANQILHASGPIMGTGASTRFNSAALVSGTIYSEDAKVFNLGPWDTALNRGPVPSFRTWFIQNNNLMIRASDVLTNNQAIDTMVVDNIVNLKAQYGIQQPGLNIAWSSALTDSDGDGIIGSAGDWQNVVAIRLAVVARSREVDKPNSSGTCTTTTTTPRVFDQDGNGFNVDVVATGDSINWSCYRYRVFETVVPLRNSNWRP